MFADFIKAFGLIFIAEMGDKTQILAMAFATRYKVKSVLMGIFFGALLNHGLAVLLGSYLCRFIPVETLQMIAGFAFVGFALWTLKIEEDDEEEEKKRMSFGPVLTVAMAFFIGELGDKTQLTAITLSAEASYPLLILMGSVSAMIVTGGLGIFVGRKLGNRIPEFAIKLLAASIFMIFGVTKLFATVPSEYLNPVYVIIFFLVVGIISFIRIKTIFRIRSQEKSKYMKVSKTLYDYYKKLNDDIEQLCPGKNYCGECNEDRCIVGYTRSLINQVESHSEDILKCENIKNDEELLNKINNDRRDDVIEALITTIKILNVNGIEDKDRIRLNVIRKNLEKILFHMSIEEFHSFNKYIDALRELDNKISAKIEKYIENNN
ncbi:hypothetical protein SH1V18_40790 [Vallitalea longa]|uniref:GDT1 family protein n=1 Tax=Vallitalea longa TaxID=2936439 RepID=A0A9W5YGN9_9FIRM|nr:TMEM165/GDT1 family protein [Vallitalea longa]GKX31599.1 hypothetical protein SH1V18_40790 [Vallitalea longa]